LGIPVLLVMAVFYGVALENTAIAREEKASLLKDVEGLKRTEEELSTAKTQLEATLSKRTSRGQTPSCAKARLSDKDWNDDFRKHRTWKLSAESRRG
jgi:hypothetical protein